MMGHGKEKDEKDQKRKCDVQMSREVKRTGDVWKGGGKRDEWTLLEVKRNRIESKREGYVWNGG